MNNAIARALRSIRFESHFILAVPPNWAMARHTHPYHELYFVLNGLLRTAFDDRTIEVSPGEFVVYPARLPHHPRSAGSGPLEMIAVRWHGPADLVRGATRPTADRTGRVLQQLRWLGEISPPHHPAERAAFEPIVASILCEAILQRREHPAPMTERMARFVKAHLREPLSLRQLAAEAHMSKFHFARQFRLQTGLTPMEFVRRQRVEAARTLLLQTGLTLEAIAEGTGFSDASHLSHAFRKVTGHTPGSMRSRKHPRDLIG